MVQVVMSFLDDTPNVEVKLSVIEALRTVTEGKVSFWTTHSATEVDEVADLRRSRTSANHKNPFRHQEATR